MSDSRDGGPAFAAVALGPSGDAHLQEGMSLRDWFAGQALAGLAASIHADLFNDIALGVRGGKHCATVAYVLADRMLERRADATPNPTPEG